MKKKALCALLALVGLAATMPAQALVITTTSDAASLAKTLTQGLYGLTVTSARLIYGDAIAAGGGNGDGGDGGVEPNPPMFMSTLAATAEPPVTPPSAFSTGIYTNAAGVYGLPGPGIVLSTGNVLDYGTGSSQDTGRSTVLGNQATSAQNALLDPVTGAGNLHYDVTQLEIVFDVAATTSKVSFLAVFGSEEYPEFVGSSFNDGFGLYLGSQNIAGVIPTGGGNPQTVSINHPDMQAISGTELDGVLAPNGNPVLRFEAAVTPGSTGNVLTVIIGDRADQILDTTAYLAALGAEGSSPLIPVMPSNGAPDTNGAFNFDISIGSTGLGIDSPIWIDPVVAIGYTYKVNSGPKFESLELPSEALVPDTDGYELWVFDGSQFNLLKKLLAGETYTFASPVDQFQIRDIDPDLGLDPNDNLAFPIGLTFDGAGNVDMSMTAITLDTGNAVPLPGSLALLGLGIFVLAVQRRRH